MTYIFPLLNHMMGVQACILVLSDLFLHYSKATSLFFFWKFYKDVKEFDEERYNTTQTLRTSSCSRWLSWLWTSWP